MLTLVTLLVPSRYFSVLLFLVFLSDAQSVICHYRFGLK